MLRRYYSKSSLNKINIVPKKIVRGFKFELFHFMCQRDVFMNTSK